MKRAAWYILAAAVVLTPAAVIHWWPASVAQPPSAGVRDANAPFVASENRTVYHSRGCRWAARIAPGNARYYWTAAEAEAYGRTPCKVCLKKGTGEQGPVPTDARRGGTGKTTPATKPERSG